LSKQLKGLDLNRVKHPKRSSLPIVVNCHNFFSFFFFLPGKNYL
jgi:hypothetical protein